MTRENFIKVLVGNRYKYKIEGDTLFIGDPGDVWLDSIKSLPSGVVFVNGGDVGLTLIETLPSDVVFMNVGKIDLKSLKKISPSVVFNNGGKVWLKALTGNFFSNWNGNIDGIDSKVLLNGMIKRGLFV